MKSLPPQTDNTLLIRTDFSDQEAWQALWTAVTTPTEDGFLANVHLVDDPAYRDLSPEQIVAIAETDWDKISTSLLIVADKVAVTSSEQQLLVINLTEEGGYEELRVIATELSSIENNMFHANMDWEEFAEAADDDGVFRGF